MVVVANELNQHTINKYRELECKFIPREWVKIKTLAGTNQINSTVETKSLFQLKQTSHDHKDWSWTFDFTIRSTPRMVAIVVQVCDTSTTSM